MTQFTKDMIPSSIVTTEGLAVWLAELHCYLYTDVTIVEAIDTDDNQIITRVAEANKFYLTAPETDHWRHISRLSVKLKPEHLVSGRLWEHVETLGDKTVPTAMRT